MNAYAMDGKCHNSERGSFNHECGKPATWIGTMSSGWKSGFCDHCKEHGFEARQFATWEPIKAPAAVAVRAIHIEVKSVYGELKAYPVCSNARCFADLAGTKTLTRAALELVAALGFEIISSANRDWRKVS